MEHGDLLGGRYRLQRPVGNGGMSVVWVASDQVLGRDVAVKVTATDAARRIELRTEALAAARLSHPNIVGVYDYGECPDGTAYVVLELVQGRTLASVFDEGPLSWPDAVTVCASIADALAAAHEQGVAHRDVTPRNVIVTEVGVKLVDFGISAPVGEADTTPPDTVLGTPAYLAPERLDRAMVDPAADIYGVGLILYHALAGRLPWDADTVIEMLRAQYYVDPAPLPDIDGLPAAVVRLCQECLSKDPLDRPDAATVAATLAAAGTLPTWSLPTVTLRAEPVRRPRTRGALALLATLVVIGSLLAGAAPSVRRQAQAQVPGLAQTGGVQSWGATASGAHPTAPAVNPAPVTRVSAVSTAGRSRVPKTKVPRSKVKPGRLDVSVALTLNRR
jgi:serine/threonine-protein kinase